MVDLSVNSSYSNAIIANAAWLAFQPSMSDSKLFFFVAENFLSIITIIVVNKVPCTS